MTDPDSTPASDITAASRADQPPTPEPPTPERTTPERTTPEQTAPLAAASPGPKAGRYGLPRALIIVLGLAAGVVVAAGMRAIPGIIGPVFMAVVLTVTVDPVRQAILRRGAPGWLASTTAFLTVLGIVLVLVVGTVIGGVQLVGLVPQYADQVQQQLDGVRNWLAGMGVSQADIESALSGISTGSITSFAAGLVQAVTGLVNWVLLLVVISIFLAVDGTSFGRRMTGYRRGREPVLNALDTFARGTRKYFGVATVFGGIVAVLDGIALLLLGIPAAGVWAFLAFITNYIPNVGFIVGLIPPAILGLLVGGPGLMVAVIAVYCVLNFIIQSVLQPKFVGDAVGLTTTVSFLSLIVWAYILGPIGAILAIPASLLFKALLVDADPRAQWLELFLGDRPVFTKRGAGHPVAQAIPTSGPPLAGTAAPDGGTVGR